MSKKKIIIIIIVVVLILLLIPYRKDMLWDGGSVEYKSVLCKYTKVHKLADIGGYNEGLKIEFLGLKIFDNTKNVSDINSSNSVESPQETPSGKVIAGTANTIQVEKNNIQDSNKFNKYLERDGKTIYIASNIKEVYYDDVKTKHVLKDYVQNTYQTIDDSIKHLTIYLSLFSELNDGGTKIYKSQEYDITIVKCNTVAGNKDYYIGDYNMNFDSDSMCK